MWKIVVLLSLVIVSGDGVVFELIRTAGGHLGTHFFLGAGLQYRFLLLDITSTYLWTFVTVKEMESPNGSPVPYDISDNKIAIYNVTNSSWTGDLSYQFFSAYGYYDAAVQFQLKPLLVDKIALRNTTIRNSSTPILGAWIKDRDTYDVLNRLLADGVFGIGNGAVPFPNSDYIKGWMNKSSSITLFTPRDQASGGVLMIGERSIPETCINTGIGVKLSNQVYLRYGDFEFNITSAAGFYDYTGAYNYNKIWPATISTMSSFISVDNVTWDWIVDQVDPLLDPYGARGNDIPSPYYKVHCSAAYRLQLLVTMDDERGSSHDFIIPGSSLIVPNPQGDCFLRAKLNDADFWVLGIPFLENYCFKITPNMSQIMFMNTTDSVVYPKPPPMGEPEPEPEDDDDFGNSMSLFNLMGGRN